MKALKALGILMMIVSIIMLVDCFKDTIKINENSSILEHLVFQEKMALVAFPSGTLFAFSLFTILTSFVLEQIEKKGGVKYE